jgi:outer membrane protein OmpA-like peptidoglycan-associated protein
MKTSIRFDRSMFATAMACIILAGCSSTPTRPEGANLARSNLIQLQSDPQLATRAPVAIKNAEIAVRTAEKPQADTEQGEHLVYIAERKIDIARALAQSRLLVDQRKMLSEQRESARLESRTREVDSARIDTLAAQQQVGDLQQKILELNAKATERGLVVTLGDVLFDTNKAELKSDAASNLAKLAAFLNEYKDRSVLIEGHTDSTGTDGYNLALSQRRADAVRTWLVSQGVDRARLRASGMGERYPVAGNDSISGRQLNRRVEVVIENSGKPMR